MTYNQYPYPPPPKPAMPAWVIVLVTVGAIGMVCLMGLLVLTNPLTHRIGVMHSQSFNQGYDIGRQLDASKFSDVKAAGYDARQACGAIEPFASFRQRPADPGEWIDGCADALHDRGMR